MRRRRRRVQMYNNYHISWPIRCTVIFSLEIS